MALRAPARLSAVTKDASLPRSFSSTMSGVSSWASASALPTQRCGAMAITPSAPSADSVSTARTTVARSAVSSAMELTR